MSGFHSTSGPAVSRWLGLGSYLRIRNAEGQLLTTPCVVPLPELPFDWKSPPLQFRAIVEPKPQHSEPLPPPGPEQGDRRP